MFSIDTFDKWDFPEKISFCCFLGSMYGCLNYGTDVKGNDFEIMFTQLMKEMHHVGDPFSNGNACYDIVQKMLRARQTDSKIPLETEKIMRIMSIMPIVAIAARG